MFWLPLAFRIIVNQH